MNASTAAGPATTDVFAGVVGPALLITGKSVEITDALPIDFLRVRAFYDELGDTSTYFRFFGIRKDIPESELRAVVSHEIPRHVTMLASLDSRLIGIGEFIVGEDPAEAELAFAVADDHHREGVGTLLLERLVMVARRCGLQRLTARTMFTNQDMRIVFRTIGLTQHSAVDEGEVNVVFDLTAIDGLEAQTTARRETAVRAARSTPVPTAPASASRRPMVAR